MATVKNVGLSPINVGDVKKYTAMQSPSYKEEFWEKMYDTNDTDYYLYALNEADKKGLRIEDIDFTNLDNIDDQWSAFYAQALADNTTKTDYGTVIDGEEPWGELTEKEYLTKLIDRKREYNIWLKEEAEIAAQKEAMSGWDKFWNGVGAWGTELLYSLERLPLSLVDFVTNWDGGESVGFIEDWRQDTIKRQEELANYERKYTNLRSVDDWDPTFIGELAMGSAQTLGLMIPSMISNIFLPGSGFWVMYSNVFLENVYEARHDPNINASQVEIILRGALMAGAEAYIEWALGSSMLDDLVLNGKRFSKEMIKVTTKEGLKMVVKDMVHEACEEALQELSGYLVNMVLSLENPTWEQTLSENLARDVGMAALMGAMFSAGNIVIDSTIKDIKSGRFLRNISRNFQAGDIISDYKVDRKTGKVKEGYHPTNFLERFALNANFNTFKTNLELAQKGKLSTEEKRFLYNQAMALGEIFNKSDTSQIQRSMELLTKLEEYMKVEGVKQETLKQADELYLSSLLLNIKGVQSSAAKEYWKNKISNKEAAQLAKGAKITKTKEVIDGKNVDNITKAFEDNQKDTSKKARKKVVKTLVEEGKTIATTDGESLEVIGDVIFVPDNYLKEGDPNFIIKSSIEKDMAQEFVVYMKSPKRLVGWSQAKAALIKAYPEMANYNDIQMARNLLFNPGGAYALVAVLPNSEFNILFLNMLDGLKQVVYKTEVAKSVKKKTLQLIEDNFRYAARMFCANNYGVNPHDLHNVLTKADQIFIKNERAKIEAEANEWARVNKKIVSKQSFAIEEEASYTFKDKQNRNITVYSQPVSEGHANFIIKDGENLLGIWRLDLTSSSEAAVDGLILPQKYQRSGIGSTVLSLMEDYARVQWGVQRMILGVGAPANLTREQASEFYKSQGYVYDTRYKILSPDEPGKTRLMKDLTQGSKEELNTLYSDLEGAGFTTLEYGNESYKYMQNTLLKENIPLLEKNGLTLKEVINNPEAYLRPEIIDYIINNFGDLSKDSIYMGLRSYLLGETDGTKTLAISENGDRYYFADVTPIKKFNTDTITAEVESNPNGTNLFEKYSGKTVKAGEFWRGEALIGKAKDVEIEFKEGGGNFYSDEQNKIYIDTKSFLKTNQDLLFALNHEFQHALQSTNRTARGFTLGAKIPSELIQEVKEQFPQAFKKGMTEEEERRVANKIIYDYSGEKEANLNAIETDYYPFIIAIKDGHYVILSPKGKKPYNVPFVRTNKLDEKGNVDTGIVDKKRKLNRVPPKELIESTNLKYFKKPGKKLRMDPDLQTFVIETTKLDQMEEWVATRIKDGSLTKQKLMRWFKEASNINEYTFKHLREAFWPNSTILTFEDLQKASITLTMEVDKDGNLISQPLVFNGKKVGEKPKEVTYQYRGDTFSIDENRYRVVLMEYWTGYADVSKIRRIVGATEILRRTETFTSVEEKVKKASGDADMEVILGVTEDFADAILNDTPKSQKAQKLREIVVKKIAAKSISGDYTYEQALKQLNKYTLEYFEDLPDETLDKLFVTEMMKKDGLKTNEEIIQKAINRNRKNAIANMKRLATTIWNNTTPKNRKRLPSEIQNMFTKEGKVKQEVYKGRPISEVSRAEEILKETAVKARRGDYSSTEAEKAYASVAKTKKQIERLKTKAKTNVKSTTKVVTEYVTEVKTEAKVITVQTTKKNTPSKLEQLLSTNFTKKRMSNMQEMTNYEYFVSESEAFKKQNGALLDSISEAEWIDIIEWFEQSEIVGTEMDLGTFKAIRMFILADLVSRIKTHNIVLDNTWLNRANNIMSSNVHSSAVELATWGKVLNSINPYRQLAEEYNVSEETLDTIQEAFETDNDEQLAKAIDELRLEIAENYVEKNMMEKIMAFRYTAMLSGPVTWLRNVISNYIVKYFNKAAAVVGEKLGGKRLADYKGYKLVGTKVRTDVAEFIKTNLLDTGLLNQLTEGYSKYDPYKAETTEKIDKDYIVRTLVNNFAKKFEADNAYGTGKKAELFNKFSAFVRKMISDDKFVNEATLRYFGKMLTEDIESGRMDANKLKEGIFNKDIVEKFAEAQWLAMGDYMKNTNFMTKAISALNESKWARYILPLIVPFAQSSWNWWIETMRYSPFGLAQSIVQLLRYEKYILNAQEKRHSSKKGQSASIQGAMLDKYVTLRNLGKGVIGTSLWALGIMLGAAGVVGVSKKDDDKYVIKVGDVEINVDNLFGSSTFLAGAALVGAIKDGKWTEMFNVTIDQMARTLFVTDLISSFKFQTLGDYIMELPLNILYSFVPNFIKMLSTNLQVYKVKYDKGILGDLERIASGIIPGLSYAFPKEIDPFTGKPRFHRIPILTQAGGISYNDISEAERAAIAVGVGAGQLTGELTVNGQKYQLDREKVNIYRGEFTNKFMTDLLNDQYIYEGKKYSRMTKEERAKAIKSILDKSADYAKIKVWTEMGNKYYASKDLYFTLKNLGIDNVYQGSGGYIKK